MSKITKAVKTATKNIKDWWADPHNQDMVTTCGITIVGCLGFYSLGKSDGQKESDTQYVPLIIELVGKVGKNEGENALLREMLENKVFN